MALPLAPMLNGFYCKVDGQRYIVVNSTHPKCRRRYSCMHELAHVLIEIHKPRLRPYRIERVSQSFAAHALMPGYEVLNKLVEGGGLPARDKDVEWLAGEFSVSYSAMKLRLKELDVLD